jgi:LysM repeat protein
VAIAGPRVLSRQQQDLVCLRGAHVDCPRYRRATAGTAAAARGAIRRPAMPRATAGALIVLALSAGISFGFVVQRGGIDLPSAAPSPSGGTAVASAAVGPGGSATRSASTPAPTPAPSDPPSDVASPGTSSIAPTATPPPNPSRTAKPKPTPSAASGVPSADRLAVIRPCPGQVGCWIYNVRSGDNLWSIAHWFGVPLDTVYAWNPTIKQTGIHAGIPLKIPTPTR